MKIISIDQQDNKYVREAVSCIKSGGLVVFPSDTVYGLLVDATNEKAVEKLIRFKNRPPGKAISVFVSDLQMFAETVYVDQKQEQLLQQFLPGPYTIVLPSTHIVQKKLESEKGTLGVRIPEYQPVIALVQAFGKPITATSANLGGKSPHYSIQSLLNQLPQEKKDLIDLIVDAGQLPRHLPSTVMDLSGETISYMRRGDLVPQDAESFTSASPSQTGKIGVYLMRHALDKAQGKPVVLILQGDLGAGKTVIAKAIGNYFGISKVVSPSYVIYYEYPIVEKTVGYTRLVHADLYNIQEENEFEHLGIDELLKSETVVVIEWGEKLGSLYQKLKERAIVLSMLIIPSSEKERVIKWKLGKE